MPITIRQRVPCQRDAAEPSLFHNGFHAVLIELHTLLISTNEVSSDHSGDRRLEFDAHLHVSDGICEDLHVRRAIDGDSYDPMLSTKNRVVADRDATRPCEVQDGLVVCRGRHLTAVYQHVTTTDIHSGTPGVARVVVPDDEPADHRALGTFANANATKNHRHLDRHGISDENHPPIQHHLGMAQVAFTRGSEHPRPGHSVVETGFGVCRARRCAARCVVCRDSCVARCVFQCVPMCSALFFVFCGVCIECHVMSCHIISCHVMYRVKAIYGRSTNKEYGLRPS